MRRTYMSAAFWHDLLRFSRCAGHFEYWWGLVLCCLVYPALVWMPFAAAVGCADSNLDPFWQEGYREPGVILHLAAVFLGGQAMVHAGLAVLLLEVRRLSNMGQSRLFVLDAFVAAVSLVFFAVLGFARGEHAASLWGEGPGAWPLAQRRSSAGGSVVAREDSTSAVSGWMASGAFRVYTEPAQAS